MECVCTVELDVENDDEWNFRAISEITALKKHSCNECNKIIDVGDWFIRESCISSYDGVHVYKTCEHCYSLRQVFFSSGWYYEMLWELFSDMIWEVDGDISVECLKQLTPVARGKALDMMDEYFGEQDDEE